MKRTPLQRRTPLSTRTGMSRGRPLQRTTPLRGSPMRVRPRRQPAHNPFPMTCPPGFHEQMMTRAGRRCQRCRTRDDLTLSHRLAAGRGGPFTAWNIDVLCWTCHDHCERNPAAAVREGWRVPGRIVRGRYVGPDDAYGALVDTMREAS